VTRAEEGPRQRIRIRPARPDEADALTRLTLASKQSWGYGEEQMRLWAPQLTVSAGYIRRNAVFVAEREADLLGYASVVRAPDAEAAVIGGRELRGGYYLDNLFVHPDEMRGGVGRALLLEAARWCRGRGVPSLCIVSDPNARAFYERMGAVYLGDTPASASARALPFLLLATGARRPDGRDTSV